MIGTVQQSAIAMPHKKRGLEARVARGQPGVRQRVERRLAKVAARWGVVGVGGEPTVLVAARAAEGVVGVVAVAAVERRQVGRRQAERVLVGERARVVVGGGGGGVGCRAFSARPADPVVPRR
jgi:hypothetical protein